jgi:hypothetical protein
MKSQQINKEDTMKRLLSVIIFILCFVTNSMAGQEVK